MSFQVKKKVEYLDNHSIDVISKEDDDSLLLDHGRGLDLMSEYMDEVTYYNNGSSLWLYKKKES